MLPPYDAEMERTKAKLFRDMFEETRTKSEHDVEIVKAENAHDLEMAKLRLEERKRAEEREERLAAEERERKKEKKEERKAELAEMNPVSRFFSKHGGKVAALLGGLAAVGGAVGIAFLQAKAENYGSRRP